MTVAQTEALPPINFIVYDSNTGGIIRTGVCPGQMIEIQALAGETVISGVANAALQYVDTVTRSVVDKQAMAPIVSGLTVTSLPSPCTVIVEGQQFDVADGEATFSFDVPGVYQVLFVSSRHLQAAVEVIQP